MSTDDDVLVPATTLQAFVTAATTTGTDVPSFEANGCGVLLSTMNNAIPTADAFAEAFLPPIAQAQLSECYANSVLTRLGQRDFIIQEAKRLGTAISPWNATRWYDEVRKNVTGPLGRGAYKGVHPVRYNTTCMRLNLRLALESLPDWWNNTKSPPQDLAELTPYTKYPYFTNTLWLTSTELYFASLNRPDLTLDQYDEIPMNRYLLDTEHMPICVAPKPSLHPAYNTAPDKPKLVRAALLAVESMLGMSSSEATLNFSWMGGSSETNGHVSIAPLSGASSEPSELAESAKESLGSRR